MPTYVAFLRAINLGGKRKFPKAAIVAGRRGGGFTDVDDATSTPATSGSRRRCARAAKVEQALEESYRRGTPASRCRPSSFTTAELKEIAADAVRVAERHPNTGAHYVSLLKEKPKAADVESSSRWTTARTSRSCAGGAPTSSWSRRRRAGG